MSSENEVKRMPAFWRNLRTTAMAFVIAFIFIFAVLTAETTLQTHIPTDHLAKEVKVNPDVVVLAEYQRARTKKIPREIAEMQAQIIVEEARKAEVPLALVVAVIEVESLFDPYSVSSSNAGGLMQLLVEDGIEIDPEQRHDIRYNVSKGCAIIKSKLVKAEGRLPAALIAYSGGAEGYADKVYQSVGRFTLYRDKTLQSGIEIVKLKGEIRNGIN